MTSVGAWTAGNRARASAVAPDLKKAATAAGPAIDRVFLAYQRRNRASSARLGTWSALPDADTRQFQDVVLAQPAGGSTAP